LYISKMVLTGWRRFSEATIELTAGLNVFHGANGQGKTNFLEAVYYLANLSSFRTRRRGELITWGRREASISGWIVADTGSTVLSVSLDRSSRTVTRGGMNSSSLLSYYGCLSVVLFAPNQVRLVGGPPIIRRRFLDRAVLRRLPDHVVLLRDYNKMLKSRNVSLKGKDVDLAEVYGRQMASLAGRIVGRRRTLVNQLGEGFESLYRDVTGTDERVSLRYRCSWCPQDTVDEGEIGGSFLETLPRRLDLDRQRGYTTIGPQFDDLEFLIDGRPAGPYASQGQARSIAMTAVLVEHDLLSVRGNSPVLLVDDLSSELDERRRRSFLDRLSGLSGQVLMTSTESVMDRDGRIFLVEGGSIHPEAERPVTEQLSGTSETVQVE